MSLWNGEPVSSSTCPLERFCDLGGLSMRSLLLPTPGSPPASKSSAAGSAPVFACFDAPSVVRLRRRCSTSRLFSHVRGPPSLAEDSAVGDRMVHACVNSKP